MTARPAGGPAVGAVRGGDVLDTTAARRSRRGVVAAVVLVLVVVTVSWWERRGPEPMPVATGTAVAAVDRPDSTDRPRARAARPARTDLADQMTFVGDRIGFLAQELCRDENCVRRVVATEDGGRSWQPRAALPTAARVLDRFVVASATELAFLGGDPPATIARSGDAGRTWQVRAIVRGDARPAPPGAPIVTDSSPPCPASVCTPWLAWVDVATGELHRLPGELATDGTVRLTAARPGPDGELLATAVAPDGVRVWTSVDGGRGWIAATLPGPAGAGSAPTGVRAFAAGDGRGYAYLTGEDAAGSPATTGYRSDDGGRSWVALGRLPGGLRLPEGVLDGELVTVDTAGLIHQSVRAGRAWQPRSILVGRGTLRQQVPGGQVLATVVDVSGLVTYYRSPDIVSWSGVTPPSG